MEKEALEFLYNKGYYNDPIVKTEQGTYLKADLRRVTEPLVSAIEVNTLDGLIDFIKNNIDGIEEKLLVKVDSPTKVFVLGQLNEDNERNNYINASAIVPRNIDYGYYIDTEEFNIMLQSKFVNNKDKEVLLKYTGLITEESVKQVGDDGVSQKVTIQAGVTTKVEAIVPNPVKLKPYRTFIEVDQPESAFIFRMKEGPKAAIFESDGGAWRLQAIKNIKEYLEKGLEGIENIQIIA